MQVSYGIISISSVPLGITVVIKIIFVFQSLALLELLELFWAFR